MRILLVTFLATVLLSACAVDMEEVPSELWVVQELGTRATSFHLNALWFLDERTGFIVGDGFQILRTRDGGIQWHRVPSDTRVWAHLQDLQFVDDTHGWAIGSGGLARTVDGGETWQGPLVLDPENENRSATRGQALSFVDPYRGWLVGKHGLIRHSSDGGESWELLKEPRSENADLWSVDFVDGREGWAVGNNGTILHTTDGGKGWEPQNSGVRDTLTGVDFLDENRGWVVGFERDTGTAVVLWTSDGGETWSEQQRRGPDDGSQKLLRYEVAEAE